MTTSKSKTPATFIPFHTNHEYKGGLLINKDYLSLINIFTQFLNTTKHFYHSAWFVN